MHRFAGLGALGLLVVVAACGGSGSAPSPAPTSAPPSPTSAVPFDYQTEVCLAQKDVHDAIGHFQEAQQAASNYDQAGATKAFGDANSSAKDAQDKLTYAPAWAPGADLTTKIAAAATDLRKSANLYLAFLSDGQKAEVDQANALFAAGLAASADMDAALGRLGNSEGLACGF